MTQEALKLALDALENHTAIKHPQQIHYRDKAIAAIKQALAQPEQDIAALVTGMEVSIDVSTGDHDSGHRLFGVVDLVQENQGSKHDLILLVQEPKANFKEALAQTQEQNNTYVYASNLAKTIWQKHYMKESPKFALLDTTEGVLTQIDNMTCGLVREKPAQPEQEPIAFYNPQQGGFYWAKPTTISCPQTVDVTPLAFYIKSPQRTFVGLTSDEIFDIFKKVDSMQYLEFSRAIEAKLKEKNS